MQVRVYPADPQQLPRDVGAVVDLVADLDVYYSQDYTLPNEVRLAYGNAAFTAGFQHLLRNATRPQEDT